MAVGAAVDAAVAVAVAVAVLVDPGVAVAEPVAVTVAVAVLVAAGAAVAVDVPCRGVAVVVGLTSRLAPGLGEPAFSPVEVAEGVADLGVAAALAAVGGAVVATFVAVAPAAPALEDVAVATFVPEGVAVDFDAVEVALGTDVLDLVGVFVAISAAST